MRLTQPIYFAAALSALLLTQAACHQSLPSYNSISGPDGVRDTAGQLYLNTSEDDRCNAEEGDHEDWRYVLIEEQGVLQISTRVDNPRVDADLFLHDGFGRPIDRLKVTESSDFYAFEPIEVDKGRYYFRIACLKGQTVYTVAAAFEAPEQTAEVKIIHHVPPEGSGGDSGTRPPTTSDGKDEDLISGGHHNPTTPEKPVEKDPPPPVNETPPEEIIGTITLVTPGDDGKAKVVIRGIGSLNGIDTSMKGILQGRNDPVTLFSCSSKKCQGIIEADEEVFRDYKKVVFLVPKS